MDPNGMIICLEAFTLHKVFELVEMNAQNVVVMDVRLIKHNN